MKAIKNIISNINGTVTYYLQLFYGFIDHMSIYCDVYWLRCPNTKCSMTAIISHSLAQTKYHALASAIAEECWLKNKLDELSFNFL